MARESKAFLEKEAPVVKSIFYTALRNYKIGL
jgi:hypothetical protein